MQDSIEYILQILPQMLEGLKITIKLFVVTLVLSLPLGLLISLFKEAVSKRPTDNFVIRWIVKMPIRFIINVGIQRNTAFAAVVFLLLRTYICDIAER
jgi:ABC-type amino acid transport system permease subunit